MGQASKLICDFHQERLFFSLADDFYYEPVFSMNCKLTAFLEGDRRPASLYRKAVGILYDLTHYRAFSCPRTASSKARRSGAWCCLIVAGELPL